MAILLCRSTARIIGAAFMKFGRAPTTERIFILRIDLIGLCGPKWTSGKIPSMARESSMPPWLQLDRRYFLERHRWHFAGLKMSPVGRCGVLFASPAHPRGVPNGPGR